MNFEEYDFPTSDLSKHELDKIADALYYQLNERMSFVKPKDQIVAELLYDLGNIEIILKHYGYATSDFDLARTYGLDGQLFNIRHNLAIHQNWRRLIHLYRPKPDNKMLYWVIVGLILAPICLWLIYKFLFAKR